MSKLTLPRLSGGYLDAHRLNSWADQLEAAVENTLSLDGTAPNALQAGIDLNGFGLLNSGSSDDPNAVLTRAQVELLVQGYSSGYVRQSVETQTAIAAQTEFTLTTMSFQPGSNNLAVYIDGVRTWAFTEHTSTSFTLAVAPTAGAKVTAVTNDYLATVSLPAHTHAWGDIFNVPVYATRWPEYSELTGVPVAFPPTSHSHAAAEITSGRLADAQRGVYVQASSPTLGPGDVGALWFW